MDSIRLEDIVHNNIINLEQWTDAINQYMPYSFGRLQLEENQAKDLTYEVSNALHGLLDIFIQFGEFKDNWKDAGFRPYHFGIYYSMIAEKSGFNVELGMDEKGIYLQMLLNNAGNLKNMNDEFWKKFFELEKYGSFEFVENASPSSKESPQLFKGYKSNLYRLMRNYFIFETQYGKVTELGWLTVRWKGDSLDGILRNGCMAFKILYQLNYSLWKISDLRSKKK